MSPKTGLHLLIQQGEHQQQDFKMRVDDSKKIARSLVAFANTDGGRLLIGVKDNGNIAGIKPQEEQHMIEAAARMYCKPMIDYTPQLWRVEDDWVLDIWVEPSENRPHFALEENEMWRPYVRRDDENLLANGVLIKTWTSSHLHNKPTFEYSEGEQRLFHYLQDKQKVAFAKCAQLLRSSFMETEETLAKLISWEVLEQNLSAKGCWYTIPAELD